MDEAGVLNLVDKGLKTLPKLPKDLVELWCDHNELTELPELPDSLRVLFCSENKLTSLPKLPPNLEYLDVNTNQLASIPELPPRLKVFVCHSNQLTTLPKLPETLEVLDIQNNKLKLIPELPAGLTYESTDFRTNPYIPEFEEMIDEAFDGPSWASSEFMFDRLRDRVNRWWRIKQYGRNISTLLQVKNQGSKTKGTPSFSSLPSESISAIGSFLVPMSEKKSVENYNARLRETVQQPPRKPRNSTTPKTSNGPAAAGAGASGKRKTRKRKTRRERR